MYSRMTPSGSIATFLICCRYLAMDAASWSLLSNQDYISNILASFTGSPFAILTYRLYSSIDLLPQHLHLPAVVFEWKRRGAALVLD